MPSGSSLPLRRGICRAAPCRQLKRLAMRLRLDESLSAEAPATRDEKDSRGEAGAKPHWELSITSIFWGDVAASCSSALLQTLALN
jgi:hypothetical protein